MTTRFIYSNSNEEPIYVQVDPWAGWYVLKKGEQISLEIVTKDENTCPSFNLDETGNVRILWVLNCDEYYVILNGERIPGNEYLTNLTKEP